MRDDPARQPVNPGLPPVHTMSAPRFPIPATLRFLPSLLRGLPTLGAILLISGGALYPAEDGDLNSALALYRDKHYGDAQPILERIVARDPGNSRAVFHLGALALRRGDATEAVRLLEQAAQLDPKSARYQNELGDAYGLSAGRASLLSKLGLARKCLAAYSRAVALEPGNIGYRLSVMNYLVQAPRIAGGGIEKAYDVAEQIRIRDPRQGALALITLHIIQQNWAQAFVEADNLQRTNEEDPEIAYAVARLSAASSQQLDRGEKALVSFLSQPSRQDLPTHAQANALLGEIREKAGNRKGAIAAYRAALALDGNFAAARQNLERLERAR